MPLSRVCCSLSLSDSHDRESSIIINISTYHLVATMMTKTNKAMGNKLKLNAFYAIVGVVVAFTAAVTALLMLYNTSSSSFDYRAFAQEEDNKTAADITITNTTNLTSSNTTLVDFVSNIEQIRGHLEQAISNKEAGNNTLVLAHTLHPIEEIYSSIEGQLSNANSTLNQTLSSNLNQLSQIAINSTVDQFNTQAQKVNGLLDQTVEKVVPIENRNNNNNNNTAFNLIVVADLLPIVESEYKEAVENGTLKEIVEYQDAQGFVSRAQSVFEQTSSSPSMKPQLSGKVQKVNEYFSDLNNAIQNKSNPEVVGTSIIAIIHEISGIIGITEENLEGSQADIEPIKVIAEIRNILNQTIQEYKQQNYDEAATLAITAYLDNYEYIENVLAEKDKALMQNIEVMLREQLRQLIQNKVSPEELQQHIDKINSSLDQAEKLLSSSSST
jgi:hypothetical protein